VNGFGLENLGADLWPLAQVIIVNVALSGDNAIVIGMAAAGLPANLRSKAIFTGISAAVVLRILGAALASEAMQIHGLLLAGGLLLFWVCYNLFRDLTAGESENGGQAGGPGGHEPKSLAKAFKEIVIADVSMSLDNILAVAGAAHEHPVILVIGLCLSVLAMALAAGAIAKLLDRYKWLGWGGLAIITYIAGQMTVEGFVDLWRMGLLQFHI
jgi:YjbE family integral membrane protein